MKEIITYKLVFGIEGVANLEVEVAEDITVRLRYSGCQALSTFPTTDEAIAFLESFRSAYKSRYPLLSGVDAIIEKLGGRKDTVARRPPKKAAA